MCSRLSVPLILSGVLQLLYNSADIIVVGRFADSVAMASVGATTSLIHLLVSMLMGLSVGASVARRPARPEPETGTACAARCIPPWRWPFFPACCSARCCCSSPPRAGIDGAAPKTCWPGQAKLYLNIYAVGLPASFIYNYGAAILRAVGRYQAPRCIT